MGPGPILLAPFYPGLAIKKRNSSALDYPDIPMIRPDNPPLMVTPMLIKENRLPFSWEKNDSLFNGINQ